MQHVGASCLTFMLCPIETTERLSAVIGKFLIFQQQFIGLSKSNVHECGEILFTDEVTSTFGYEAQSL